MKDKRSLGLGLIESLVAVSLFAILSTVAGGILFTTMRSRSKVLTTKELRESGNGAILTIEDYLKRYASQPAADNCASGGYNGVSIDIVGLDGETTTFQCDNNNRIASSSALLTPALLTPDSVACSSFTVSCQPSSAGYPVITIDFDLEINNTVTVGKELSTALGNNKQHFSTTVTLKQKI